MSKKYDVGVWLLTYYKVDAETGDALCDDDGNVIGFYLPNEDCSYLVESIDPDDLVEVI